MKDLLEKARKIVESCSTPEHFQCANRYLELLDRYLIFEAETQIEFIRIKELMFEQCIYKNLL